MIKRIKICLSIILLLSLAGCKDTEELPEQPPTIVVGGQNPLKTGIHLSFIDDSVRVSALHGIDSFWMEHNVDTSLLGYYQASYHALSLSGMAAKAHRNVWVVVKPESMKGLWDVSVYFPESNSALTFVDSLDFDGDKIIINNLHTLLEEKAELSLAADLQDSVYMFEQYLSDSLYCVFGSGTIDESAMQMVLHYSIVENNDTIICHATYLRDSILTNQIRYGLQK